MSAAAATAIDDDACTQLAQLQVCAYISLFVLCMLLTQRSLVTRTDTDRSATYDFLLVITSNRGK